MLTIVTIMTIIMKIGVICLFYDLQKGKVGKGHIVNDTKEKKTKINDKTKKEGERK